MPPRFTYWTIIFGGQATAFRSGTRDELLPTFKQIQAKHPDAQLRYFARGKLWYSEDEARAALIRERFEKTQKRDQRRSAFARERPRSASAGSSSRPGYGGTPRHSDRDRRGGGWRPGGEHKDPRARFKVPRDVKRRGMARKFGWKKKKDEEK